MKIIIKCIKKGLINTNYFRKGLEVIISYLYRKLTLLYSIIMKKLLLGLCFLPLFSLGQNKLRLNEQTERYSFTQVFDSIQIPKDSIYKRGVFFLKKGNESSKIYINNPNNKFSSSYFFTLKEKMAYGTHTVIPVLSAWTFEVKNGKYRVVVNNIRVSLNTTGNSIEETLYAYCSLKLPPLMGRRMWKKFKKHLLEDINSSIEKRLKLLKKHIISPEKTSDW